MKSETSDARVATKRATISLGVAFAALGLSVVALLIGVASFIEITAR
jgi:hypothetical protein